MKLIPFRNLLPALLMIVSSNFVFGNDLNWKGFDQGLEKAKQEDKYIFVDFYADWCQYCKMLDQVVLKKPEIVKEISANYIPVKINTESMDSVSWRGEKMTMAQLSKQIGVETLPTLLFLNSKYEIVGSHVSYIDNTTLYDLLTYVSSGARERNETLDEFLESRN